MDIRRLQVLLQLSRLGSMRDVADELGMTTSSVSQQIAALAREMGVVLIEPAGRRVRLTPAGRRLAEHAVTILAAVEAARLDLDPAAEPAGTLRVTGFATAVRRSLLPVAARLAADHPRVRLRIHEHEPAEALALLAADDIDLALIYDYNLAPAAVDRGVVTRPVWSTPWSLAVPADTLADTPVTAPRTVAAATAAAVFTAYRDHDWIVSSRGTADEQVVRTIASMAGYEPAIVHRADSLELVQDLIVAGLGVALLPANRPVADGVRLIPLANPDATLRAYTAVRRGRSAWPPLALVLDLLTAGVDEPVDPAAGRSGPD